MSTFFFGQQFVKNKQSSNLFANTPYFQNMKRLWLIGLCMCSAIVVAAQTASPCQLQGVVVQAMGKTPLSGAYIQSFGTGDVAFTGDDGAFNLRVRCTGIDTLMLRGLARIDLFIIKDGAYTNDTLEVAQAMVDLEMVNINPNDAKRIVQQAVAKIPENYPTSSYVAFGFFRNYKFINQRFRELTELQMAAAMRMTGSGKSFEVREGYAIDKIRRTLYSIGIDAFYEGDVQDLFKQNLIYHNEFAPFNNLFIDHGDFTFDSTTTDSTWVINYALRGITGENHGVSNYVPQDFLGEAQETGYLIINKSDFAITKLVRESVRNKRYEYPGHNNFLYPDMQYTEQFHEGFLECNYVELNGWYYPVTIFHAYRNTFTHVPTNSNAYYITDYSEWHCDSISEMIDPVWMERFDNYKDPELMYYTYQPADWQQTPPWYFVRKEQVFDDLKLIDEPDLLFTKGGK